MRILIATDAWHPQVNGVVRTLTSLARAAEKLGVTIVFCDKDRGGEILSVRWAAHTLCSRPAKRPAWRHCARCRIRHSTGTS